MGKPKRWIDLQPRHRSALDTMRLTRLWEAMQLCLTTTGKPWSLRGAATHCNVPHSTLADQVKKLRQMPASERPQTLEAFKKHYGGLGRPPTFPLALEKQFARRLANLADRGFAFTCEFASARIAAFLSKNPQIQHHFHHTKGPGVKWWRAFLRRHPELAKKKASRLSRGRYTACNPEAVSLHLQRVAPYAAKIHPRLTFNEDETQMHYDETKRQRFVGVKGKPLHRVSGNPEEREVHVTAVICIAAEGPPVPPLLIFPGKTVKKAMAEGGPEGTAVMATENGWITEKAYVGWFKNMFLPHVNKTREEIAAEAAAAGEDTPDLTAILYVDGHKTHIGDEVLELAESNNVVLFCFPPHCTHVLQPLDIVIFAKLKRELTAEIANFLNKNRHQPKKTDVAALLGAVWDECLSGSLCAKAFRSAGLVPYNPNLDSLSRAHLILKLPETIVDESPTLDEDTSEDEEDDSSPSADEHRDHDSEDRSDCGNGAAAAEEVTLSTDEGEDHDEEQDEQEEQEHDDDSEDSDDSSDSSDSSVSVSMEVSAASRAPLPATPGPVSVSLLMSPSPPTSIVRATLGFPRMSPSVAVGPLGPLSPMTPLPTLRSQATIELQQALGQCHVRLDAQQDEIAELRKRVRVLEEQQFTVVTSVFPSPPRAAVSARRQRGIQVMGPVTKFDIEAQHARIAAEKAAKVEARKREVEQRKEARRLQTQQRAAERAAEKQLKSAQAKAEKVRKAEEARLAKARQIEEDKARKALEKARQEASKRADRAAKDQARKATLQSRRQDGGAFTAAPPATSSLRKRPAPQPAEDSSTPAQRRPERARRPPARLADDTVIDFACERKGCGATFEDKCDECGKSFCAKHVDHPSHSLYM